MFDLSISKTLNAYLGKLESDLTHYKPDSQNQIAGYLPGYNKDVHVMGEELHEIVSQAYEKYLESSRNRDVNKPSDYARYKNLQKKLIIHVQSKAAHCHEDRTICLKTIRAIGLMEDFLWLVGVATEYQSENAGIDYDGAIQKLASKLFDELKVGDSPTSIKDALEKSGKQIKQSCSSKEYSQIIQGISGVKQLIGF